MSVHIDNKITSNKRPIIADELKLLEHNCLKHSVSIPIENNHDCFVDSVKHPSGWKFIAHHTNILTTTELSTLTNTIKDRLACSYDSVHQDLQFNTDKNDLRINSSKLNLPPMLFGNDVFRMEISNIAIELNASDAIMCWASQHVNEELVKNPIVDIKVPYAKKWTKLVENQCLYDVNKDSSSISTDMNSIITNNIFHSDWTFSSDYIVTVIDNAVYNDNYDDIPVKDCEITSRQHEHNKNSDEVVPLFPKCRASILRKSELITTNDVSQDFLIQSVKYKTTTTTIVDTTTTSSTSTAISCDVCDHVVDKSITKEVPSSSSWSIAAEKESGIDYNLLRCTDQPILFFDEFILYQDDLEDCGEITYDGKIRVMPNCWFALSKQYLRVDGVAIRCRETRLFHHFENDIHYHYHAQEHDRSDSITATTAANNNNNNNNNKATVTFDNKEKTIKSVRIHMDVCWRELVVEEKEEVYHNKTTTTSPSVFGFSTLNSSASNVTSCSSSSVSKSSICRNSSLWGKDGKTLTHLLPLVNEQEGISQYYTLTYNFL